MKRSQANAIKSAPGSIRTWVIETETRDCIVAGTDRDTTTIAYVAIGAESWGPLLAAAPELLEQLRNLVGFIDYHGLAKKNLRFEHKLSEVRAVISKVGEA